MAAIDATSWLTRRQVIQGAAGMVAATSLPFPGLIVARNQELTIRRILVQEAKGRRLSPVAPNAGTPYRGYDVAESVLRIQTVQGIEGVGSGLVERQVLEKLIGLDPFKLFEFGAGDRIVGPAPQYASLLADLRGGDVALIDLIGKALGRTASDLLGAAVRKSVQAYDGSIYMEDLLKPDERTGLVYIEGAMPSDPVELVVRKAQWVVNERPEGFQAFKVKLGRVKWMGSFDEALARDIAVTNAIRAGVGPDIKILVDANKGYGNPVKLAAGESHKGGIQEEVYTQRFKSATGEEPLVDVEQADMNWHGFLYLRSKAAAQAKLGMTMAPHNFGSKMGFYSQVHLGMVTPNWDVSEVDDAEYPALIAEGVEVKGGLARLTGAPGLGVTLREAHLEKPKFEIG